MGAPDLPTPWADEPDHLDLVLSGFRCEIKRVQNFGYLCGYIVLPVFHPLHGLHYNKDLNYNLPSVHLGWAFSEEVDGAWTIGFDCGHPGDLCPSHLKDDSDYAAFARRTYTYRTIGYVQEELTRAAAELAAMMSAHDRIRMLRGAA